MKPALILYATREGHTRRMADRLARGLLERGWTAGLLLKNYSAAIVAASVHTGKHERES